MRYFLFLLFCCGIANAQTEDAWVYFKDKENVSFYMQFPEEMLSSKALERRSRQNIPLDDADIPISSEYISQLKESGSLQILAKSKWLNAVHVRGEISVLQALKEFDFVAEVDFLDKGIRVEKRGQDAKVKHDKFALVQALPYGFSSNQIEMLGLDALHKKGFQGGGITIAVMDAGFPGVITFSTFDSIRKNKQLLGGYNLVDRNTDYFSRHSHGTSVLSTMAGFVSDSLVGTAPKAGYYLFITEDSSQEHPIEESLWVEAAEMADSLGVDIINTSLGYSVFDNPNYNYNYDDLDGKTAFITRGAEIAATRGMIVVNSAGNEGDDPWRYVTSPADAKSVLTVGAVDHEGIITAFSSVGPTSDGRIKPDVVAQGRGVVVLRNNGYLGTSSGTSFSSPIIAGAIACLWEAMPEKSNFELLDLIKKSASQYNNPDIFYGYGMPDFSLFIEDMDELEPIEIGALYPNPTQGEIIIELPSSQLPKTLKVFTTFGEKIFEQNIVEERTELDLEFLNTGVYFFKLGAISTLKIIKN